MKRLWKNKKGYNMPDWFDLIFSISVRIMVFFVFFGLSSLTENIIQGRAVDYQENIADAYNLINYVQTKTIVGSDISLQKFRGTTLGELLVHVYHTPSLQTYLVWSSQTTTLFNRVFGENNWYLSIHFQDDHMFFNLDGESQQTSTAYLPREQRFSSARVTSIIIPTMNPEKSIELNLHIKNN